MTLNYFLIVTVQYITNEELIKMKEKIKKLIKKKRRANKTEAPANDHGENNNENFHWERIMASDLDKIYDKWCQQGIPVEVATSFPAFYMVNFVFFHTDPMTANHILMSAISKELIRNRVIEHSENTVQ